ncbi:glycosyltransferase family 39 protein [Coleofasciculus sp. G2-EDA-02]|uniref:glycosyltransferase family 39 protein n=1 Tax=Coleofasciculus sp. G2-EDA-02 TaxID=3069529 RepID=UPI0032F8C5C3
MLRISQKLSNFSRLRQWLPISLIMLLATSLYLYKLEQRGLWIDEFISIADAQDVSFNRGRLLYYILLHFWMLFGNRDAWLRGLAILFALGSVFLVYRLGRYLFTDAIGLMAALMLTLSPLFINHAQEVRYYTMSVCLGLGGTLALAYALNQPTNLSSRFWWVFTRFLAIITTPLNGALLFPDLIIIGMKYYRHPSRLLKFGTAFLLILVASIPVGLSVQDSSGAHRLSLPIPGVNEVLRELRILTAFSYPPPPPYLTRFLQLYILMVVAVIGIAVFRKRQSEKLIWVLAWAFVPTATILVFSLLFFSIWNTRYVMLVLPYILILIAIGFREIWSQWRPIAWGIAVVYAIAVSSGLFYYYTTQKRYMGASDHYRRVAQLINANEKPNDIIVWSIIHELALPLEHYHRGSAPIYVKNLIEFETNKDDIQKIDVENWLRELPPIESRLWIVYGNTTNQVLRQGIEEKFYLELEQKIGGLNVFLVKPKPQD